MRVDMKHFAFLVLTGIAAPAFAQAMDPSMPGMDMGSHPAHDAPRAPPTSTPAPTPAPAQASPAPQAQGVVTSGAPVGTDQSPGSAEPPPVAHDLPAARYYDPQAMAQAEMALMNPQAAPSYSQLRLDLAEYQFRNGHDGYRWEGEAWTGDLNRFVFRSRGEGATGQRLDSAELQALYSRALDPWWNLQVGIRQDIRPTPARSYATIGIEGLAPYKLNVLAAAYLSDKGQLTGRVETSFDERLTRRFVLQPRMELNFSAQDMPVQRLGDGLNNAELGLRLRYEISRQFAPYVGISWTWAAGKTADYIRAAGDSPHQRSIVIGIRAWL
jgi:copper resistance protein B